MPARVGLVLALVSELRPAAVSPEQPPRRRPSAAISSPDSRDTCWLVNSPKSTGHPPRRARSSVGVDDLAKLKRAGLKDRNRSDCIVVAYCTVDGCCRSPRLRWLPHEPYEWLAGAPLSPADQCSRANEYSGDRVRTADWMRAKRRSSVDDACLRCSAAPETKGTRGRTKDAR